jgi:hypothetical protein
MQIAERWHGIYARHFDRPFFYDQPEPDVYIVAWAEERGWRPSAAAILTHCAAPSGRLPVPTVLASMLVLFAEI